MKRIILLTGDEDRHAYVRLRLASDRRFNVVASYCEGAEKSLGARVAADADAFWIERAHVAARSQCESDFFAEGIAHIPDRSNRIPIPKGSVNDPGVVAEIEAAQPDLLLCYGASLIRSTLLEKFSGRFLNVHLGLSPWYRGSGTNVWPLINGEPWLVGATYMHIDHGIDTGRIIHQIRAELQLGDSPHSIGNRLIRKLTEVYADIAAEFDNLTEEPQPDAEGRLYKMKDFDANACEALYAQFEKGMIRSALESPPSNLPKIVTNRGLARL